MHDSPISNLIAIDGGGTFCRFAYQTPQRREMLERGSANVFSAPKAAIETLQQGLEMLRLRVGISAEEFASTPAYVGLAGVFDTDVAETIARQLPLNHVNVEDDRRSAVAGALGTHDGTVIGIGTGSFLARQSQQGIQLIGGYGFQVGDEASGAWLGRRLLQTCLHVLDGILPPTPLTAACLAKFERGAADVLRFVSAAKPAEFGQLAPMVTAAAQQNDPHARSLLSEGADYICAGLTALGRKPGELVCLTGSVAPHYTTFLPTDITDAMSPPQGDAIEGALRLARMFAQEDKGNLTC